MSSCLNFKKIILVLALGVVTLLAVLSTAVARELGIRNDPCATAIPKEKILSQDFGQLCRYEKANVALTRSIANRIVYFGDSITEGWKTSVYGVRGGDIVNRGIGGQTSAQMLVRFRADVINLKPTVVHIMLGTNDIAGNTGPTSLARLKDAIRSMSEQAQFHKIRVMLGSILPSSQYKWASQENPTPFILQMNQWLKSYAQIKGFTYVDYYSQLVDRSGAFKSIYTYDGIHPNTKGYEVMGEAMRRAINSEFN